jgi:MtN3 and saliva related transmembrane protein
MDWTTLTGVAAACCTTVSYFPQLKKCWETNETDDLSLGMFLTLFAGIALWVVYGILRSDPVVLVANAVSLCLLSGILFFKLRGMMGRRRRKRKHG